MMHNSTPIGTPCEFIDIHPVTDMISKCQIKVCYVGEQPNRNGTIITKEVAEKMANSLPGCPIVGYYNKKDKDFEEHNREIDMESFEILDTTRPYGFVDLNAKAWFQEFVDDEKDSRLYLVTEGYIWTGQYPETKRIFEHKNNQSMELNPQTIKTSWTEKTNEDLQFLIINEATISKLCILGEDFEPCFEGAQISHTFSLNNNFKLMLQKIENAILDFSLNGEKTKSEGGQK